MTKGDRRSQATIVDVAQAAGVSTTTVSRVINNKDDVSPETMTRVQQAVAKLNYTPSLAAKGMRSRKTNVIGLVLPELTNPYELAIVKGVGTAIRGSGFSLLIYAADDPPLSSRASWEQEHLALLSNSLSDGNIVVTPSTQNYPENARIVTIDPQVERANVPSVIATNRAGALAIMEYLTGLGHRRIGFVGGRPDTLSAMRRFEGYRDGLIAAGIPFNPDLMVEGDYTRKRGQEAAHALLTQSERPTAIFAANDLSALGVMDLAQTLGLRIPQELSIVGFDDIPEATQVTPRLTTVDQSIEQMGFLATQVLIGWLKGEEPENKLYKVSTHLRIRETCLEVTDQERKPW